MLDIMVIFKNLFLLIFLNSDIKVVFFDKILTPVEVKYLSVSVANFLKSAAFVPVLADCVIWA